MTREGWSRLEELFHAARSRPIDERAAFLDEACAGNSELRRELDSLLAQPASSEPLFAAPAVDGARMMSTVRPHIAPGDRIGNYAVGTLLGAGGMGEVYHGRDTKLGRDVALKILPALFTTDPNRLARFEREARVLASLNQPNIAAIYGVEESGDIKAIVLELVEGDTLADRLKNGPLSIPDALRIARQIADALDVAHEKGIIHRDLKPANIKVTPAVVVKVLDFGLAKAAGGDHSPSDLTHSPTLTIGGTREGVLIGTVGYMSPEQARGKTVDRRADSRSSGRCG